MRRDRRHPGCLQSFRSGACCRPSGRTSGRALGIFAPGLNTFSLVSTFAEPGRLGPGERLIFREELFPCCAPGFEAEPEPGAAALARAELLFLSDPDHSGDWARMFDGSDVAPPVPRRGAQFNSFVVYLQAVVTGAGIGLGWGRLMDGMIAEGRLHRIGGLSRVTERGYFCIQTARARNRDAARAFCDWLVENASSAAG